MIRDHFRVLVVNLSSDKGQIIQLDGRNTEVGGSGLAALLFNTYGFPERPWNDPGQPVIFAIGPLTGYFPLMSKTVCSFKSPYHDQYTESHAGGRSALSLCFANLDALVIVGKSERLCCLSLSSRSLEIKDVDFMKGMGVNESGRLFRGMSTGSGHRTIFRIGAAGENGAAMANINVDTYRHFGRLGGGAALGAKNLKGIIIHGDAVFSQPDNKEYGSLFAEVYKQVTATDMMKKYHNLGTSANLQGLNDIESLPWRNLQATSDPAIEKINGQRFATDTLLRNSACSGCPVGCIHVGCVREMFDADHRYTFKQVAYDYEMVFSLGSMLGVTDARSVLNILDVMEKAGLDAMSGGVALAWATEATEKGLLSEKETVVKLSFGDAEAYQQATEMLGNSSNDFYRLLGQGSLKAAAEYGGAEFACVLGQEMAGYATGEVFFAAQSLGFRHSHLDSGAYSYDQKHSDQDIPGVVEFLISDEAGRAFMTSMVACLFARGVYKDDLLAECLTSVGYPEIAAGIDTTGVHIQKLRWQTRIATGFTPDGITIPKRFFKIKTWKGPIDQGYLNGLKSEYGKAIIHLAGV
ncbi:MAG: aldehyde ferredoxin oxidoreductase C-terminal domain-containing protein [Thermodesulfobacteriota bacterium]|nr:aldehyde ferredoxin oxidoreductase C-terminal domain-containing protein [Thermodesulfobacteriota bacterium]